MRSVHEWVSEREIKMLYPTCSTLYFIISIKLFLRCTDYFVIFYIKRIWRMLHIYYKEKVN